jgi:hypothetical protein
MKSDIMISEYTMEKLNQANMYITPNTFLS